jgi:hypothetical protein
MISLAICIAKEGDVLRWCVTSFAHTNRAGDLDLRQPRIVNHSIAWLPWRERLDERSLYVGQQVISSVGGRVVCEVVRSAHGALRLHKGFKNLANYCLAERYGQSHPCSPVA